MITGPNIGKYVGRKGMRSWDWKGQEDPNNARVFTSITGIKIFHGHPKNAKIKEEIILRSNELRIKIFGSNLSNREINTSEDFNKIRKFRRAHNKIVKELSIPYTDYYEAIEVTLNKIL